MAFIAPLKPESFQGYSGSASLFIEQRFEVSR